MYGGAFGERDCPMSLSSSARSYLRSDAQAREWRRCWRITFVSQNVGAMMPANYLRGLPDAIDGDVPGVYGIAHARVPGSWRIVCSYADGKRAKGRLFTNLAAHGQDEERGSWEWHHIVERQHYADVDFSGRLPILYAEELPCVLLAKE